MLIVRVVPALLLLSSVAVGAELSPERVVLSSGGLAELSATVPVSGRTTISFDAPLAQIDDVLKSLVVTGDGVRVVSASMAGREPLSDTFAGLPLQPDDLQNSVTLLTALKGYAVEAHRMDKSVRGVVLGVEVLAAPPPQDGRVERPATARLSIATDAGAIEHIDIDEATRIIILDPEARGAVEAGLQALASDKSAALRTIDVTLEGPSASKAILTYVVGAPVWKPTWRVVLTGSGGPARLQGWAVLENRTGTDWSGVALTLSSGTPVALHQSLYESVVVPRPEAPLQVGQRLRPEMDRGVQQEKGSPAPAAEAGPQETAAALGGQADMAAAAAAAPAQAEDSAFGGALARGPLLRTAETLAAATFRLPSPVDLEAGRSLTLPFFDGEAAVRPVSLFQAGVSDRHPVAAVEVENRTGLTLPGGIVTVYEQGIGFVGDAEFAGAAPGEKRVLPYALDTKVRVSREVASESAISAARASQGFLVVDYGRVHKTTYQLNGDSAAPRTVLIEHVANPGWRVEMDVEALGRDGDRVRLQAVLRPGENRTVTVTETTVDAQQWSILDAPEELILELLSLGDRIDPRLLEPLARIVELRNQTAEVEARILKIDERVERIRQDQERVSRNLQAVDRSGDLGQTYLDRLKRQEAEMAQLESERDSASDALAAAEAQLSRLVRDLSL